MANFYRTYDLQPDFPFIRKAMKHGLFHVCAKSRITVETATPKCRLAFTTILPIRIKVMSSKYNITSHFPNSNLCSCQYDDEEFGNG